MADVWISARSGGTKHAVAEGDYLPVWAGNWSARIELADLAPAPTGLVTLSWLGRELTGQVVRSGQTTAGRVFVQVAGGSGQLGQPVPAKLQARGYQNCPLGKVLDELAREAGETVSATITPAVRSRTLASWPRRNALASQCLDDLARSEGLVWRVLPDGSLWMGAPSFAEAVLSQDLQKLDDEDPSQSTALYATLALGPQPGDSYKGKRVGDAHYTISASGDGQPGPGAFVRLWWLDDGAEAGLEDGRLIKDFSDLVRQCVTLDWLASYSARVVTQASDGTLEVVFDSKLMPPRKKIPYLALVSGARLAVDGGARCSVHFANGNPATPIADLFEPGAASRGIARNNDAVTPNTTFQAWISAVQTALSTLGAPIAPLWPGSVDFGTISSASDKVFLP